MSSGGRAAAAGGGRPEREQARALAPDHRRDRRPGAGVRVRLPSSRGRPAPHAGPVGEARPAARDRAGADEENELRLKALPPGPARRAPPRCRTVLFSAGRGGLGPSSGVRSAAGGPAGIGRSSLAEGARGPDAGRGGRAAGLGSAGVPASQGPDPAHRGARPVRTPGPQPAAPTGTTTATGPAGTGQPDGSPPPTTAASDRRHRRRSTSWTGVGGPGPARRPDGRRHRAGVRGRSPIRSPATAAARRLGAARAPPAEPPLPSREETERQIRAEAAAIKQDNDQRLEQQQEDLHVLRDDERHQFLDELRMILKVHRPRRPGRRSSGSPNRTGRTERPGGCSCAPGS